MNYFIGIGQIIKEIKFDFFINSKKIISAADTFIKIQNTHNADNPVTIKIIGFNDLADKMYRRLYKGSYVLVYGTLTTNGYIEIIDFQKI